MKKILIIEDDAFVARVYSKTFEGAGYEVAVADDGPSGLKLLDEFKPDLVQMDLMVPGINGVELIQNIRANPVLKSVPILVVSNCYQMGMVKEAWKAGASMVIAKIDCSPKLVLDRVEALLAASATAASPSSASVTAPVPLPSPTVARISSQPESNPDTARSEIRQAFLNRAPQLQQELRSQLQALIQQTGETDQHSRLYKLGCSVHALAGHAALSGLVRISHMADALDLLIEELHSKPGLLTPSPLRTIARAVDCLGRLITEAPHLRDEFPQSALILAVDDDPLSLLTLSTALGIVHLKAVSLDDPHVALKVLSLNRFDLIFMDAEMPGMNGFDACQRLHALPTNSTTPVVFVTSLANFESRARSTTSGAVDLIGKPFLLIELAVKALTFLLRGEPGSSHSTPAPAPHVVVGENIPSS